MILTPPSVVSPQIPKAVRDATFPSNSVPDLTYTDNSRAVCPMAPGDIHCLCTNLAAPPPALRKFGQAAGRQTTESLTMYCAPANNNQKPDLRARLMEIIVVQAECCTFCIIAFSHCYIGMQFGCFHKVLQGLCVSLPSLSIRISIFGPFL